MTKKQKKRKFNLEQFSSNYLRPSKYLLISSAADDVDNDNNISDDDKLISNNPNTLLYQPNDLRTNSSSPLRVDDHLAANNNHVAPAENILYRIGNDCLMEIIEYLSLEDLKFSCLGISKQWDQIVIPHFLELSREMYENDEHMSRLTEYGMKHDRDEYRDGLFTEGAQWKAELCYDEEDKQHLEYGHFSDDEDVIEHNDCDFRRRLIPFGSPLCKGTIQKQFELVQDQIDLKSYKEIVEKHLGVSEEEQGMYEINPFVIYDKIEHERAMIDSYINEVLESCHVDCGNPIWFEYNLAIHAGDERFDIAQVDYLDFPFYGLRSGISRMTKQAGVVFYEPGVMEDALYQLKHFIYLIIKDAYETKFPNKTTDLEFEESEEQYSRFCVDPDNTDELCFDDNLDTDKKLSAEEIVASFHRVTGRKFYFAKEADPYNLTDHLPFETEQQTTTDESDASDSDYSDDVDVDDVEEVELPEEEDNVITELSNISDENFIDDSDCIVMNLDNLGDGLPDQLMKVSIRVHEQVYGRERAHQEKLYLKNWYGNGDLFFSNCSKQLDNPQTILFEHESQLAVLGESQTESTNTAEDKSGGDAFFLLNEQEQIELDKKEDLEYFGYSLYEDDLDEFPIVDQEEGEDLTRELEQASEEESLQYQLRRMLREQSYECIVNYFKHQSTRSDSLMVNSH